MEENIYETKAVKELIVYFSVPTILSLIVEILVSVVDTIFAGHLLSSSVSALAAMGLLAPLLRIYTASEALSAVSTSVFIARYIDRRQQQSKYFWTGIILTVIISLTLSMISYLLMDDILNLLGAEGRIYEMASIYMKFQLISNVFSAIGYTLTSCIRALGHPGTEMIITSIAVLVNILLNAVFAFGLDMGFAGLACGTLFSEIICAVMACIWLYTHHLMPEISGLSVEGIATCAAGLIRLGIAETVVQAMGGCTGFFVNDSIMLHAGAVYVAVWNIVQTFYTLLMMPIVGFTQGVQTIIAYFSEHGDSRKSRETIDCTMTVTVIYGVVTVLIILFARDGLSGIFADSEKIKYLASKIMLIIFISLPLTGVFYTIITFFQVTGSESKAVGFIVIRQVILIIPLVYFLPFLFQHNPCSVFLSIPAADVLALILAVRYYLRSS